MKGESLSKEIKAVGAGEAWAVRMQESAQAMRQPRRGGWRRVARKFIFL